MEGAEIPQVNTYECQVCGFVGRPKFTTDTKEDWVVHKIHLIEGNIAILGCPRCSHSLDINDIFEGYKARIRSGADSFYH